jgi:type I restriction enzyme S subunit
MSESNGLPKGWAEAMLGDVLRIIRGVSYKKEQAANTPRASYLPLLRATNIGAELDFDDLVYVPPSCVGTEQMLLKGDIVVASSSGSKKVVGKASRLTADWSGSFGAFCMGLRVVPAVDSQYICYFMQTHEYRHRISELASGSNINNLRRDHIESFPCRIAPLPEQHRIVEKIEELLSHLDAGVRALERAKANLKRYRASVLKSAVEGRLTEQWRKEHPQAEDGGMLLDRILRERREKWEKDELQKFKEKGKELPKGWESKYQEPSAPDTSELPDLPEGWVWVKVDRVGKVQLGRQRAPQHHTGTHMRPYLRVANVFEDRIDLSDVMEMNFTPAEFPVYELHPGDILLNEGQSMELVGRPAMYRGELPGACFTNSLVRFQAHDCLDRNYALFVFLACLKTGRFQKIATITVNIAHLGAGRFAELAFPLPPLAEQEQIVALVEERLSQIDSAAKTIDAELIRSKRLRQSILKQAFEGELVPQDPKDEPASVLLEQIKSTREQEQPKKKAKKVKVRTK